MGNIYLFGGPNGAGKTTIALNTLPEVAVREFVNADSIAAGLSPLNPESSAIEAGRLMLERIKFLRDSRVDFAFESTLASKSFAQFIKNSKAQGFRFHLIFVWLPSVELAIQRVRYRVQSGGHNIPEDVVRRRYRAGIRNLFSLYLPLADSYVIFDNSGFAPRIIAELTESEGFSIFDPESWEKLKQFWEAKNGS